MHTQIKVQQVIRAHSKLFDIEPTEEILEIITRLLNDMYGTLAADKAFRACEIDWRYWDRKDWKS